MTSASEEIERKLRDVDYCVMKSRWLMTNSTIALRAARLIKRQRKEIADLMAELAYHGIYPR